MSTNAEIVANCLDRADKTLIELLGRFEALGPAGRSKLTWRLIRKIEAARTQQDLDDAQLAVLGADIVLATLAKRASVETSAEPPSIDTNPEAGR